MTDDELKEQFKRCKKWNDPKQWDTLGMLYLDKNYLLNANYCFEQALKIRTEQKEKVAA